MDITSIKRLHLDFADIDSNKSYEAYDVDKNYHIITLYLNKEENVACPYCNSKNIVSRGTKSNEFEYSIPNEKRIFVKLYRHVYKCSNCNKYFKQNNPFTSANHKISEATNLEILNALKDRTRTFTSVANEYNVSPTYVINLFDRRVSLKREYLPVVLAIDEVYSKRLTSTKYCCILYAPRWRKIIDVLECRQKNYLIDYFSRIPLEEKNRVLFISIDMYMPYREALRLCFPNAIIACDSFHVIKQLQARFNSIRIRVMRKYEKNKKTDLDYRIYKKFFKLLLVSEDKIPINYITVLKDQVKMTGDQIISHMLSLDKELTTAYYLKQKYREFNLTATYDEAQTKLEDLIEEFKACGIKEYVSFWKLLVQWKIEIINSFHIYKNKRISNGPMEAINDQIKTIFKVSNGNTHFTRTRNRIMYCLNENTSILSSPKEKTNKAEGKKRGKYKKNKTK